MVEELDDELDEAPLFDVLLDDFEDDESDVLPLAPSEFEVLERESVR